MRIKLADGTFKTLYEAQLTRGFSYETRTGTHELRLQRKGPQLTLVDTFTPSVDAASALAGQVVTPRKAVVQSSAPVMGRPEVMPQSWFDSEAFGEEFAWSHWEASLQDDGELEYRWTGPDVSAPDGDTGIDGWTAHVEPEPDPEPEPKPEEPALVAPIVLREAPKELKPRTPREAKRAAKPPKLPVITQGVSEAAEDEALGALREAVGKAKAAYEKADAQLQRAQSGFQGKVGALASVVDDVQAVREQKRAVGRLAGGVPSLVAASVMQCWNDDGRITAAQGIRSRGTETSSALAASLDGRRQELSDLEVRLAEVTAQLERPRGFKVRGSVNDEVGSVTTTGGARRTAEHVKLLLSEQRELLGELQDATLSLASEYDTAAGELSEHASMAERIVEVSREGLEELLGLAASNDAEGAANRWLQKRTNSRTRAELEGTARQWMQEEGAQQLSGAALRSAVEGL